VVAVLAGAVLAHAGVARAQFDLGGLLGKEAAPTKKVAYVKVGTLTETPQPMPPLFGGEAPTSLKELLERLADARSDASVKAIILDVEGAALGFAQLTELHESLRRFDAVDKDVFVHADSMMTGTYLLATAGTHISMVPTGDLFLTGMYSESPYLKGMLDKMSVVADFEHCGDFKTAAEMLTRTEPSPQQNEMTDWLLDDIYKSMVTMIADSRGMTPEQVRAAIDGAPYSSEGAKKAGLIDAVQHRQDFVAHIKSRYGDDTEIVMDYGKKDPLADIPQDPFGAWMYLWDKIANPADDAAKGPSVAIVYVEGAIMTGVGQSSPFGGAPEGAFSTTIRRALDKAAEDDNVKAVVLRVDSPGGSATASEIIHNAAARVGAKKPIIVSMGNVAASGGYYVACNAQSIFAEPTTITGSIGVVGGKLVTTGGWNKLGINWAEKKRGEMAGIMSSATRFNEQERARIVTWMNEIYDVFKGHVVAGRGTKLTKKIDDMAGGRVYTGRQALDLGLVDKLGGLQDAIKHAAREAGVSEYEIRVIPQPPTIFDMLFHPEGKDEEYVVGPAKASIASDPAIQAVLPVLSRIDPLRVQAMMRALQVIDIVNAEGVALMDPTMIFAR
jgi:protease-4